MIRDRRAKIIGTIGPATDYSQILKEVFSAGLDVARLNFSHGSHEEHAKRIKMIRKAAEELKRPIAIMQDLQGPKIRIGKFVNPPVTLKQGHSFTITTRQFDGDEHVVSTSYERLPQDVKVGNTILINDGLIKLKVEDKNDTDVHCTVVNGGSLYDRRGINLPGVDISAPSLTEKDKNDLDFGLEQGVDYVALSFIRKAESIEEVKERIGNATVPVIAKLEKPEALDNLDAIIEASDVVMVARGDLGVEVSTEKVPHIQKMIIEKCRCKGKPVITATQMLDSMMVNAIPTRAEASDVANAVFDGTDAVMLSGETAFGKYPLKAVQIMDAIIKEAEQHRRFFRPNDVTGTTERTFTFSHAICRAASQNAHEIEARYIVVFTRSGYTARIMSCYRPGIPVIALTDNERVQKQLGLYWGVTPLLAPHSFSITHNMNELEDFLKEKNLVDEDDTLVIIAGSSMEKGGTNLMRLHRVKFND